MTHITVNKLEINSNHTTEPSESAQVLFPRFHDFVLRADFDIGMILMNSPYCKTVMKYHHTGC